MSTRVPPSSRARYAYYRLRDHLARYYKDHPGMSGMGYSCPTCGSHCGRPHSLCDDLSTLADLDAWCENDVALEEKK